MTMTSKTTASGYWSIDSFRRRRQTLTPTFHLFTNIKLFPLTCQKTPSCRICRSIFSSCRRRPRRLPREIFGNSSCRPRWNDSRPRRAYHFSHTIHSFLVRCRTITSLYRRQMFRHCTFLSHHVLGRARKKLNRSFVSGRCGPRATHPPSLSARVFCRQFECGAAGSMGAVVARRSRGARAGVTSRRLRGRGGRRGDVRAPPRACAGALSLAAGYATRRPIQIAEEEGSVGPVP